jgi:hypothetical protein
MGEDQKMKWIAAASIFIAMAAGVFAFLRDQAADAAVAQVASLKAETQKALADTKAAQAERDALRKETADLKLAAEELRSAVEVAGRFLESEKAVSARLREDLAMTTARLAAAGTRQQRPSDALPPGVFPPGLMPIQRPQPIAVRAAPGGPTAVGAAAPAR